MNTAISSNKLSKIYRIGSRQDSNSTFVETLTRQLTKPIRNLKNIRKLSQNTGQTGDSYIWALKDINFDIKEGEVVGIIRADLKGVGASEAVHVEELRKAIGLSDYSIPKNKYSPDKNQNYPDCGVALV